MSDNATPSELPLPLPDAPEAPAAAPKRRGRKPKSAAEATAPVAPVVRFEVFVPTPTPPAPVERVAAPAPVAPQRVEEPAPAPRAPASAPVAVSAPAIEAPAPASMAEAPASEEAPKKRNSRYYRRKESAVPTPSGILPTSPEDLGERSGPSLPPPPAIEQRRESAPLPPRREEAAAAPVEVPAPVAERSQPPMVAAAPEIQPPAPVLFPEAASIEIAVPGPSRRRDDGPSSFSFDPDEPPAAPETPAPTADSASATGSETTPPPTGGPGGAGRPAFSPRDWKGQRGGFRGGPPQPMRGDWRRQQGQGERWAPAAPPVAPAAEGVPEVAPEGVAETSRPTDEGTLPTPAVSEAAAPGENIAGPAGEGSPALSSEGLETETLPRPEGGEAGAPPPYGQRPYQQGQRGPYPPRDFGQGQGGGGRPFEKGNKWKDKFKDRGPKPGFGAQGGGGQPGPGGYAPAGGAQGGYPANGPQGGPPAQALPPRPEKFEKYEKFQKGGKPEKDRGKPKYRGREFGEIESGPGLDIGTLPEYPLLRNWEELKETVAKLDTAQAPVDLVKLLTTPLLQLVEDAKSYGVEHQGPPARHLIVDAILKAASARQQMIRAQGVLDMTDEGFGILTYTHESYRQKPFSAFVAQGFVEKYGLLRGHILDVLLAPKRADGGETCPHVIQIEKVMGQAPEQAAYTTPFEELTPYYPTRRILLETAPDVKWDNFSMRIVDMLTPIGFGQRGLLVAPPRTGKTVLMQGIANAIERNYPDAHLIVLLVDERPEEVTDIRRQVRGEVISSTFDEAAESHIHAAEMVIEKARRMVEAGQHVVILLDSITRLARAYNAVAPSSGKILSGGVEATALQKPKRFFGSARNIEGGGSLTIIGTALVETGSKQDEVIFEEFKGTGNSELHLDRLLSDKRIFPAINFEKSGTRKEELLYHPDEMAKIYSLRRALKGVPPTDAMEMLITRVRKTKTNIEFLMGINR